jgi:hypothetical protein
MQKLEWKISSRFEDSWISIDERLGLVMFVLAVMIGVRSGDDVIHSLACGPPRSPSQHYFITLVYSKRRGFNFLSSSNDHSYRRLYAIPKLDLCASSPA